MLGLSSPKVAKTSWKASCGVPRAERDVLLMSCKGPNCNVGSLANTFFSKADKERLPMFLVSAPITPTTSCLPSTIL